MPVQTEWFDSERRIICTTFVGRWTKDELIYACERVLELMSSVNYTVDCIVNLTESHPLPPPGSLRQLKRMADFNHPNTGVTVYVKASPMMQAIAKVFWKLFRPSAEIYPFEFANTVAQAHALLTRHHEEWARDNPEPMDEAN